LKLFSIFSIFLLPAEAHEQPNSGLKNQALIFSLYLPPLLAYPRLLPFPPINLNPNPCMEVCYGIGWMGGWMGWEERKAVMDILSPDKRERARSRCKVKKSRKEIYAIIKNYFGEW
jgi:hypothetical protein